MTNPADTPDDATDAQRDQDAAMLELAEDPDPVDVQRDQGPALGMSSSYIGSVDPYADGDDDAADDVEPEPMTVDQALAELGHHHDTCQREKETLVRARIAELEALNGSQAQALADADDRVAELERRLEQNQHDYARARRRITELEDARVRVPVRLGSISEAGRHVSVAHDVRAAMDAEPEVDEAAAQPDRSGPMLHALAAEGLAPRRGLPGERVAVRETCRVPGQPLPMWHVIGFLTDGVLRTDESRDAREVPAEHVPAYVAAVRNLPRSRPTARRLAAARVTGRMVLDR